MSLTPAVFTGEDALKKFQEHLSVFDNDDAVGGIYAYARRGTTPYLVNVSEPSDPRLLDPDAFEMVIIDSGSSHGNLWKFVFYPRVSAAMFIDETGF